MVSARNRMAGVLPNTCRCDSCKLRQRVQKLCEGCGRSICASCRSYDGRCPICQTQMENVMSLEQIEAEERQLIQQAKDMGVPHGWLVVGGEAV